MYLKRLEMHGFKSFANKTVLEFMPGITAVIGPNGSGKSNISDSIRWLLGEQSMKSLRGSKSEDIIFAGTENRKSLGFAEASIVIDNTDGKLPIEYNEVTVTRRIYRSGESGYFINKAPCRLKDILELFMDTGIGKDGYSIIGQGKIDEILSNKSEERRHIFEEAAGIVKYRTRKIESEKKLEQTKLNLLRINDILSEIEGNIEPLKKQSEKAKKFLSLREELKNIEVGLFLHQIDNYKLKIKEIQDDLQILQNQETDEIQKSSKLQEDKNNLKIELDKLIEEIEKIQNEGFETSNKIQKIENEISLSKQKIETNKENEERYAIEIEELQNKINELKEEKEQKLSKKTNLFKDKERFQKDLDEKTKELENLTGKLSEKEKEIEAKKIKLSDNIDAKFEKASFVNTQKVQNENLEKRKKQLNDEVYEIIAEIDAGRLEKEEIAKEFYEIETKRNEAQKALEKIIEQKEETSKKIKKYEEDIKEIDSQKRINESRLKFLKETEREKEGYVKSVKSLLLACENNTNLAKGNHGVLASILEVPKEYQTAIEMCLGASLQNLVTETEEDAKKLVEYLRKNNLGRASFLPITSVKGKKLEKIKDKGVNVIGIASDLVKTKKKYEDILLHLLGRTVVVETMDDAIALAKQNSYSFRIVTIQGDLINPSGAITGGSVTQKTVNILGRKQEIEKLEKTINEQTKKLANIETQKTDYISSVENILEQATNLETALQETQIDYATKKQKLETTEENIEKLELKLQKTKDEITNIENEIKENIVKKEETEQEIILIEQENEALNSEISMFADQNKEKQQEIDDLNFEITNLKISVSSFTESEASIDEIVERMNLEIQTNENTISTRKERVEKAKHENESLKELINLKLEEIEKTKEEAIQNSGKIEELKQNRIDKNKQLEQIEKDILEQFNLVENLKEQVSKIEIKKSKLKMEVEQIINKMWEEYEITPNNARDFKKPENVQEVQKKVNSLRNQIKALGSINIDSIEEYKQTKERYDFMTEQKQDLEESITKLKKIINDMMQIMKEQFTKQFQVINKNFKEIFTELFGGGKAELKLTDSENILESGIEIEVQPPGKKLQNMMLLSGGEKALTAIALLFAILKINPAPFCVLDEIEAALDDVNVYRYAEYLKKFSKEIQFLVITHRKGTMEAADTVYGITMEEKGISKLLSMKLK